MKKKPKTYEVLLISKDGPKFVEVEESAPIKFLYNPDKVPGFINKSDAEKILKDTWTITKEDMKSEWTECCEDYEDDEYEGISIKFTFKDE